MKKIIHSFSRLLPSRWCDAGSSLQYYYQTMARSLVAVWHNHSQNSSGCTILMMCRSKAGGTSQGLRDIYPTLGPSIDCHLDWWEVQWNVECGWSRPSMPPRGRFHDFRSLRLRFSIICISYILYDRYDIHMEET
jgi:hypothetical protein